MAVFGTKWNTANERYKNELQAIEKQKATLNTESQLQAAKDQIVINSRKTVVKKKIAPIFPMPKKLFFKPIILQTFKPKPSTK